MKKQFITRVFLSSLVLALTSLFGGGNLLAQKAQETVLFYESFDKCTGTNATGANDNNGWSGSIATGTLSTDNVGWTFVSGSAAYQCAKVGASQKKGSATTPVLNIEGDATLTFKAGAWKGDKTTLNISILNGGSFILNDESLSKVTTVTMKNESWSDYEIAITGATTSTQIKFEGYQKSAARFFLDEVKITRASSGDPTDKRNDPELDYSPSVCNATIGQTEGFPTLSNPHGVTGITFSSTDEKVATVDESGNVTLTGIEGTTTITASFPGNDDWKPGQASYTLNVSKPSANLAYSASSCHVVIGEAYTLPKLTYTKGVTGIVFDSSDESVATVDAGGVVTLTGSVGTTTITASLTDDATYADGSASYELTVKKPNLFVYKKITSVEGLIKGATYVFVCEGTNKVGSEVSGDKIQSTTATLTNGILEESVVEPMEFVLEIKEGKYYFKSGEKYLKGASGETDMTMIGYKTSDDGIKWNILFKEENVLIYNDYDSAGGSGRRLMYRAGTYNVFGHYGSTDNKEYYNVQLYQKVYPLTVSSATSGYATFYNEEEAYQMPKGLTGYAVTKAENGDCITRKTAYAAGATVPAKTPLLIIGTTDGGNYYPAVVSGTGLEAYAGSNLLEGTRDANGFTQSANKNVYYYKLGLNAEKPLGFYWGAENGAAFKMTKATTAYLAVPKKLVEGANALFFDFGPETGINEIQTEQADKAIFDLSGRRVQKATKGFYIVGGKKVLVK